VNIVKPLNLRFRRGSPARRSGFTLVEVAIAVILGSLVFIGVVTMYMSACGIAMRTNAQVAAANTAGQAMEKTLGDIREAYTFALPDDASGFTPPSGDTVSQFETTYESASIDTGIEITFMAAGSQSFLNSAGTSVAASPGPYSGAGVNNLWIYRADSNGAPDASAGQYLWAYGSEEGNTINRSIGKLCDTAAGAAALPNAVQIWRPVDSANPPTVVPYQVEMRIVSSYYSYVNGSQSSESSGTSMLTGKVALMRNHP